MVVEDGLVQRDGEFEGGDHGGKVGDVVKAVVDRGIAGVANQGGDGRVDRGAAQIEVGEELVGQVDFVVGLVGVAEDDGEGTQGLGMCSFAGFGVLFGFRAPGGVSGGHALRFSPVPSQGSLTSLTERLSSCAGG
ncbi:hypothetical protein [Streptomyces sp. NPDC048192]|uniref:hypothetical protein n=1 Tax=Streptomyces sp. NPDC048192 TaxID=3365510 RepID=UPI003714D8FD